MSPTTYSTVQRLGVLAVSAIAISVFLTYTYVPPAPPKKQQEEKQSLVVVNNKKEEGVIVPLVLEEPTALSVDEVLVTSEVVAVQQEGDENLVNAIVDEAIAAAVAEMVESITQEEPLVIEEKEEEATTSQEAYTKTFELSSNGEENKEQVNVDFVLIRLDASYFVWVSVGAASSLDSITVAMPASGAASGVWGNTGNPQDLATATRLAKKTKQVIHFSSSLPPALEDQYPQLRMFCEKEIVRNILNA